ncbi:MAG: hypothetical protein ABIB55_00800 [Candidatus Nealsonbacteria bacterium]
MGEIINEVMEKGKFVYQYDYKDNQEDGFNVGLYPEITERGVWLPCFPDDWKEGLIAVKQWIRLNHGDTGGQAVCKCSKHVACWSVGRGLIDLIERTMTVYEVAEELGKQVAESNPRWFAYLDPEVQKLKENK